MSETHVTCIVCLNANCATTWARAAATVYNVLSNLRLKDGDDIAQRSLRPILASRVMGEHDAHNDAKHALPHCHVAHSEVHVLCGGVPRLDHVAICELHGLGTGSAQLACGRECRTYIFESFAGVPDMSHKYRSVDQPTAQLCRLKPEPQGYDESHVHATTSHSILFALVRKRHSFDRRTNALRNRQRLPRL